MRDVRVIEELSCRALYTTNELYSHVDKCAKMKEWRMAPELGARAAAEPEANARSRNLKKWDSRQILAMEVAVPKVVRKTHAIAKVPGAASTRSTHTTPSTVGQYEASRSHERSFSSTKTLPEWP